MKANKFDDLLLQVHPHTDVPGSVVSAITGIAGQFEAVKNDPAAIQALCDDLRTAAPVFGSHVEANTIVEPAPSGDRAGRQGPDRAKEAADAAPAPHKSPALGESGIETEGKHPHGKKH